MVAVVSEAEVDQSSQIDGSAAVCEADPVAGNSTEPDFAMSCDDPRDGAFNHRPVLCVRVLELVGGRVLARGSEQCVVFVKDQRFAGDRTSATIA